MSADRKKATHHVEYIKYLHDNGGSFTEAEFHLVRLRKLHTPDNHAWIMRGIDDSEALIARMKAWAKPSDAEAKDGS